jgi:protein gp37
VKEEWLRQVFRTMGLAHRHTFMILTKRPERMKELIQGLWNWSAWRTAEFVVRQKHGDNQRPLPNVWLGVTAENQEMADQRIPILLQTPAAKRFVSVEPMLGPVDLTRGEWASTLLRLPWLYGTAPIGRAEDHRDRGLDWVICGPENGPGARPTDMYWARDLRAQCLAAKVLFFMKTPRKGFLPADLMVQEFPEVEG